MKLPVTLILASLLAAPAAFAADAAQPVVVELFTSQGCSSCPPADRYLEELAARPDVLPLAFHVDYWDDLGWKDTFSNPAFTRRQRRYSTAMRKRGVYTPQMIVNGQVEGVGGRRSFINAQITAAQEDMKPVPLTVTHADNGALTITIGSGMTPDATATLWLLRYSKSEDVKITRGENSGSTIRYRNVVREVTPVGNWQGQTTSLTLPPLDPASSYAVILQNENLGPILAALPLETASR
jgi:hypothetical protein